MEFCLSGMAQSYEDNSSSISPAFRSSHICLTCAVRLNPGNQEEEINNFRKIFVQDMYSLGKGAYPNEAEFDLENWQVELWGSMERYNRLLEVKKSWDPNGLFWCHHCVGDEE